MWQRLYPDNSNGGSFGVDWAEQRDLEAENYRHSGIRIFLEWCFLWAPKEQIMAGFAVMCSTESAIHHTDISKRVPLIRDPISELHAHPLSDRVRAWPSLSLTPTEHMIFLHLLLTSRCAYWELLASSQKPHQKWLHVSGR